MEQIFRCTQSLCLWKYNGYFNVMLNQLSHRSQLAEQPYKFYKGVFCSKLIEILKSYIQT